MENKVQNFPFFNPGVSDSWKSVVQLFCSDPQSNKPESSRTALPFVKEGLASQDANPLQPRYRPDSHANIQKLQRFSTDVRHSAEAHNGYVGIGSNN